MNALYTPHRNRSLSILRAIVVLVTLCLAALAPSLLSAQADVPVADADPLARLITSLRRESERSGAPAASALALRPAGERSTSRGLLVPVEGIRPEQLRNTYDAARSGGRRHDAIDIHAPRGTPVVATADGTILKLHSGARGGLSIYQLDNDGRTRYYYAHLDRYAAGIHEGVPVRQGDVIGYVGDTGNAQKGDYHLHFSVARLVTRSRWWDGVNLNPYTLLRNALTVGR
jgi:peptidoglycan LD-endopeptidase LytH